METIIAQKYRIKRILGKGGQGTVFLVEDLHLKKYWAMKLWEVKEKNRIQMQREIHALKRLHHQSLPMLIDSICFDNQYALIMEYIEGCSLQDYLKKHEKISQDMVIRWGKELASVLGYLHTRKPAFVYGDLKPSNIIVTEDGHLKLIDFGTTMEEERYTKSLQRMGTCGYAAPEIYGSQKYGSMQLTLPDARCDIYSIGVVLHYMLTGCGPTQSEWNRLPITGYDSTLSKGLELIVERCLKQNPSERYQNCQDLLKDLEQYQLLEKKYVFEYGITWFTICFLMLNAVVVMLSVLFQIREISEKIPYGEVFYAMVCAIAGYAIKQQIIHRKSRVEKYFRQEISVLKTDDAGTYDTLS